MNRVDSMTKGMDQARPATGEGAVVDIPSLKC